MVITENKFRPEFSSQKNHSIILKCRMKLRYVEITIEWLDDTIFDNQAYLYISVDTFYPSLSTNLTRLINQFPFIYFDK